MLPFCGDSCHCLVVLAYFFGCLKHTFTYTKLLYTCFFCLCLLAQGLCFFGGGVFRNIAAGKANRAKHELLLRIGEGNPSLRLVLLCTREGTRASVLSCGAQGRGTRRSVLCRGAQRKDTRLSVL